MGVNMRRASLWMAGILLLVFSITTGAFYALAESGPFQPGSFWFPLQDFAEQNRVRFARSQSAQALAYLTLAERRLADLAASAGSEREAAALEALSQATDRLVQAVAKVPEAQAGLLRTRLADFADLAQAVLSRLSVAPLEEAEAFARFQAKLSALHRLVDQAAFNPSSLASVSDLPLSPTAAPGTPAAPASGTSAPHPTLGVAFPPGSAGARHEFYPLIGKHASLECRQCHPADRYTGTPASCQACHLSNKPAGHFTGRCSACHTPAGWTPAQVDHQAAHLTNCLSCHTESAPSGHFSGQCSLCHTTRTWTPARYNHGLSTAANCANCHDRNQPTPHYPGQCSACHATTAWIPADFDHAVAGATNCSGCHTPPGGHYNGGCSACHATSAWLPASFDHQVAGATNCSACHSAPAGHFSGQCSACHATAGWRPASFDHNAAGATNCSGCHSAPGGHFSGQCSACHVVSGWKPAFFNHDAAGASSCSSCHARPSNHFSGQCSDCHSTSGWLPANFSHAFPINHGDAGGECAACHPSGGSSWTCYNCHDQGEMEKRHAEENAYDIAQRCLACHPNGQKDD